MRYRIFSYLLLALAILNLADYVLTLRALSWGIPEGNPIMDAAIDLGLFHLVKAALPTALLLLVWLFSDRIRRIRPSIILFLGVAVLVYAGVTVWHLYGQFIKLG